MHSEVLIQGQKWKLGSKKATWGWEEKFSSKVRLWKWIVIGPMGNPTFLWMNWWFSNCILRKYFQTIYICKEKNFFWRPHSSRMLCLFLFLFFPLLK
jgi:hypothetical protein